jgi:uncharacterized protein YkwD
MALDDRDWYQQRQPPPPKRFNFRSIFLLVVLSTAMLVIVGYKWVQSGHSNFNGEAQSRVGAVKFTIVPGLPALTLRKGDLYPPNDPWKDYLADEKTCPGAERTDLPLDQQADIMVCLVNFARQHRGLSTLATYPLLNNASLSKANKIVRCNDFAHDACGEAPNADAVAAGYFAAWGENLYVGEGRLGAPRLAMDGWLNSDGHRENLFQPDWRSEGIAVMKVAHLEKYSNALLWVNEFGAT